VCVREREREKERERKREKFLGEEGDMYHLLCMSIVVPLAFVGTSAIAMLAQGSLQGGPTASVPKYNSLPDSTPLRSTLPSGAHSMCDPPSRILAPIFSGVFYVRVPQFLRVCSVLEPSGMERNRSAPRANSCIRCGMERN
jgi:hypothetical protein